MGKNKIESKLIKLGSNPEKHHGSLSDPVYKTSTIIFEDYKSFIKAKKNKFRLPYYGRFGNYTSKRFEETVAKIYESEASIELAAQKASKNQSIDLVFVATGILHKVKTMPEKTFKDLNSENLQKIFYYESYF